jgi:hypothetical protein
MLGCRTVDAEICWPCQTMPPVFTDFRILRKDARRLEFTIQPALVRPYYYHKVSHMQRYDGRSW